MKKILSRWLPCATLAIWSGLILYFYFGGHPRRMSAYLTPLLGNFALVAAAGMLVLAVCLALFPINIDACAQGQVTAKAFRRRTGGRLLAFTVLLLPICASAFITKDGLSAASVGKLLDNSAATIIPPARPKITTAYVEPPLPSNNPQDAQASQSQPPQAEDDSDQIPRSKEGNMIVQVTDLLYAAQDSSLRPDFKGQTIELVGQLMPDNSDNPNGDRFKLVRMFIVCCAADARPVAVLVQSPTKPNVPEMGWVKVVGSAEFLVEGGRTLAVVKASKVEATNPPEETMLY
ncbi:MAG TPA: hypothetical protein VG733_00245 [Chthoniobacteraceae bacterium]|nr:hypothetical protein [Chthoniobacteraceae bacterium]